MLFSYNYTSSIIYDSGTMLSCLFSRPSGVGVVLLLVLLLLCIVVLRVAVQAVFLLVEVVVAFDFLNEHQNVTKNALKTTALLLSNTFK